MHVRAEDDRARCYPEEFRHRGHLRLSDGLEVPRDLITDLDPALTRAVGPASTICHDPHPTPSA
ncbi:MAG: hypothetical protein BGP03_12700 [Pseudonocardia sp. 73-21]|nr:MAG: hypothetical protein BGP03_12700 [Pseudonocardia sp. 73-21]